MHVKEIYVIFIHLYDSGILLIIEIQPQLQLINLHRNRRYFVIKLHTWFCLSYFLKTNIKFYCIYQYVQPSYEHHTIVSRFAPSVVIKQPYSEKNCWVLLIWVTGHCNRAAVSRNRWLKIWKQENVSLRHLCPARHFSVKTIILPEDLELYIMMYMCTKFQGDMITSS
jgi:hypothetical protein